ncbi:MAG: hypothetical protein L3K00_00700 [Thermoplasmata archaeon]|nr:hypothetical protein [Thermoplasmata archaeon]
MSEWADRAEEAPLDDRVVEFLQDRPGRVAFNGLRRALDAHPESLVRSLRRLERHGVVLHGSDGYGLVDRPAVERPSAPARSRPFAEVTLAPGVSQTELFGRLAGRWFGPLRWIGLYEPSDGPWLVWSVEGSRAQVRLGIRRGRLTVVLDRPDSTVPDGKADDAARRLLGHAIDALEPTAGESSETLTISAHPSSLSYAS